MQLSPVTRSAFGLIVKVVGPPVTTVSDTFCVPLVAHTSWNQLPVTLTGSLKVMVRFLAVVPWTPASAGALDWTNGAASIVKLKT